jgi:hypothetical protein
LVPQHVEIWIAAGPHGEERFERSPQKILCDTVRDAGPFGDCCRRLGFSDRGKGRQYSKSRFPVIGEFGSPASDNVRIVACQPDGKTVHVDGEATLESNLIKN